MEQVEKTLWECFLEYRTTGRPGIPRDELLQYMMKVAEAIDISDNDSHVMHCDIRPQNIIILNDGIQLRESRFAGNMRGLIANVSKGCTPEYAAPELFDGLISRFTDQFSLAVVYEEMLTGHRPYPRPNLKQLIEQHISGKPDLSFLALHDQQVVARALSRSPDERFQCCKDFVEALAKSE